MSAAAHLASHKPGAPRLQASQLIAYAIVLGGALIMLAPFYFMFVFATHADREILSLPATNGRGTHA